MKRESSSLQSAIKIWKRKLSLPKDDTNPHRVKTSYRNEIVILIPLAPILHLPQENPQGPTRDQDFDDERGQ